MPGIIELCHIWNEFSNIRYAINIVISSGSIQGVSFGMTRIGCGFRTVGRTLRKYVRQKQGFNLALLL